MEPREIRVGTLAELRARGCVVVSGGRHGIAVFLHEGRPYAVDNRCPHLGFPLARGTVRDGILTCHWHHWRFDLTTGGCFTAGGEDVPVYPVRVEGDEVFVRIGTQAAEDRAAAARRLEHAMEEVSTLGIAKAILRLRRAGVPAREVVAMAARFGARRRQDWSNGMTVLTALGNLLASGEVEDDAQHLALVHGAREVARSCSERPPRRDRGGLPGPVPQERLEGWFRRFVEERQEVAAERVLRSAIAAGWEMERVARMVFSAATDHPWLDDGHALDYAVKAFELVALLGWANAGEILPAVVPVLCAAQRAEEDAQWRHPYDYVGRLSASFEALPRRIEEGRGRRWDDEDGLVVRLLADDPSAPLDALDDAVRHGAPAEALVRAVARAAAERLARFALRNEVFDWDTAHHAFTTAHATYRALRIVPALEVLRGAYHAAVKVALVRFLAIPPARLPWEVEERREGGAEEPLAAMDTAIATRRPAEAARALWAAVEAGADVARVRRRLVRALLAEDPGFHDFQSVEAAVRLARELEGRAAVVPLVGAVRFLAVHCPTDRFVAATVEKAVRLERGEDLAAE